MKLLSALLGAILLLGCRPAEKNTITIAAAANVQFALEEITHAFTNETGISCTTTIGSSGALTAQIMAGAPFDIFISADLKYPNELFHLGKTTSAPEIYAYGVLVLWTMNGTTPSMQDVGSTDIDHIAIANPRTAPYGAAAKEALTHYGLYDAITDHLVFGESVSQTTQFIFSGAAGMGLTAKSVVVSPKFRESGHWIEIDSTAYSPIVQGAVIIPQPDKNISNAALFLEFLFSEKARNLLIDHGYRVPD